MLLTVGTGALSAAFLNDALALVSTPLPLQLTRALKLNPVPYLLAIAGATNLGSLATLSGHPQNMSCRIGWPLAESAFVAAALLITRRLKPQRVLGAVDWSLVAQQSSERSSTVQAVDSGGVSGLGVRAFGNLAKKFYQSTGFVPELGHLTVLER